MHAFATKRSAATNGGGKVRVPAERSVVLVTGANRGIGQSTAMLLAEHGYTVLGTAREPSGESMEGFELVALMSPRRTPSTPVSQLSWSGRVGSTCSSTTPGSG